MPASLSVTFPPQFTSLLQSIKILSFDFVKFTPVGCVRKTDYIDSLMIATLVPLVFFVVVFVAFCLHRVILYFKRKGDTVSESEQNIFKNYLALVLYVSSVILPGKKR